ncbi:MAG: hypothetical protein FWE03_01085 [Firmicutes bacterium]|nr:hypothetical protein [Bacillota bacterium]
MKDKKLDEIIAKWMGLSEGVGKGFWTHNMHTLQKTTKYRTCRHCGKDIPNGDMAEAYRKKYKKAYIEGSLSDPLEVPGDCIKTAPDYSMALVRDKVIEKILSNNNTVIEYNHEGEEYIIAIKTSNKVFEGKAKNLGDAFRIAAAEHINS